MKAEILKEAVEIARSRKWIAHSPLFPGTTSEAGQRASRCGALAINGSSQVIIIAQDSAKQAGLNGCARPNALAAFRAR